MTDVLKQFVKDVERKTTQRDIIAVGREMAAHCDKRIEKAAARFQALATACDAYDQHPEPNGFRALARAARRYARSL